MYFLKVGDTVLPTPSYYCVNKNDIDSSDSARSDETGVTHRRRIREGVATCDVKWILSGDEANSLLEILRGIKLSVTYLDPVNCGYKSSTMYATNKKSTFYQVSNDSESSSYWEISCRLIEY